MATKATPSIYRLILEVASLDRAEAFYGKLLRAKGRRVGGGRLYFDCGPVILALLEPSADGTRRRARPNPQVVYFGTRDIEGVYRRARRLRCLWKERSHNERMDAIVVRPWGERSFYVRDPFGNPLCFVDDRTRFTGK